MTLVYSVVCKKVLLNAFIQYKDFYIKLLKSIKLPITQGIQANVTTFNIEGSSEILWFLQMMGDTPNKSPFTNKHTQYNIKDISPLPVTISSITPCKQHTHLNNCIENVAIGHTLTDRPHGHHFLHFLLLLLLFKLHRYNKGKEVRW